MPTQPDKSSDLSEVRPASADRSPFSCGRGEVEPLELCEADQRGQVAAQLLAPGEVELSEFGEVGQRGQIAA